MPGGVKPQNFTRSTITVRVSTPLQKYMLMRLHSGLHPKKWFGRLRQMTRRETVPRLPKSTIPSFFRHPQIDVTLQKSLAVPIGSHSIYSFCVFVSSRIYHLPSYMPQPTPMTIKYISIAKAFPFTAKRWNCGRAWPERSISCLSAYLF
jgi:hypothetical protein